VNRKVVTTRHDVAVTVTIVIITMMIIMHHDQISREFGSSQSPSL
jgi:hypothetical protein